MNLFTTCRLVNFLTSETFSETKNETIFVRRALDFDRDFWYNYYTDGTEQKKVSGGVCEIVAQTSQRFLLTSVAVCGIIIIVRGTPYSV